MPARGHVSKNVFHAEHSSAKLKKKKLLNFNLIVETLKNHILITLTVIPSCSWTLHEIL